MATFELSGQFNELRAGTSNDESHADSPMFDIPFIRPDPPSLRSLGPELARIEASGIFTNYGPTNSRFERALENDMFGGRGSCLTVCNATIGLMMAIRYVVDRAEAKTGRGPRSIRGRRYALMPSFTFAAAAHAADWVGLTPLFCDIDEGDWAASAASEDSLIQQYGDEIAVIVPYATFGNNIDLKRYERIAAETGIPIVVDAAASLGSLELFGEAFGASFPYPIVFSMHATKTFSTGEGGVIYSTDRTAISDLRTMGNFGFGEPRSATMPGLNSKISEVSALLALTRLKDFDVVVGHRERLAILYRSLLPGWGFQRMNGLRCAYQFMPVLPPAVVTLSRDEIVAALKIRGIGAACYFAPHVAEQPFFRDRSVCGDLTVTERVSRTIIALPLWDGMTGEMVKIICETLLDICGFDAFSLPASGSASLATIPSMSSALAQLDSFSDRIIPLMETAT